MKIGKISLVKNSQLDELKKELHEVKMLATTGTRADVLMADWILNQFDSDEYRGNDYKTYSTAVKEISKKYTAQSDWGNLLVRNVIDLRSIFILSEGIDIIPKEKKEDAKEEIEWAKDFLEYNNLDREAAVEYAKEAEIEGKIALKLEFVKLEKGEFKEHDHMIKVRFISWQEKQYKIETDENDYLDYKRLYWKPKNTTKEEELKADNFVYKKFGGRITNPDSAQPKIMNCLTQCDNLEKSLRDWRETNRLFSFPVPDVEVSAEMGKTGVTDTQTALDEINWKVKKAFAHLGKFSYVQPETTDANEKEILRLANFISGCTGVPIHWLGFPELLKQRATADDLREMANYATSRERIIWHGTYEELIMKAIKMKNEESKKTALDPWKLKVVIPYISKQQWENLEKVWMPAVAMNILDRDTVLAQFPGIDAEQEIAKRKEKEESEFEQMKKENEDLNARLQNPFLNKKKLEEEE